MSEAIQIIIRRAGEDDYKIISGIGNIAVEEAHRGSCSKESLNEYLQKNYNDDSIKAELNDSDNIYHLIFCNEKPAGFSKINLNAINPDINRQDVTKLDRIYLLKEFYNLKLGYRLLSHNILFSRQRDQSGMWLFTWIGNERAISFYLKTGFTIAGSHMFKVTETHSNKNHLMFLKF